MALGSSTGLASRANVCATVAAMKNARTTKPDKKKLDAAPPPKVPLLPYGDDTEAALLERSEALFLAAAVSGEPDSELLSALASLAELKAPVAALSTLCDALSQDVPATQARYAALFGGGPGLISLLESDYGRRRGVREGRIRADLSGFYLALGLALEGDDSDAVLDHLATELEFYATLLTEQARLDQDGDEEGATIVRDARRSFLREHLGPFARDIAAQPAVVADPVYGPALAWTAAQVTAEAASLGVNDLR